MKKVLVAVIFLLACVGCIKEESKGSTMSPTPTIRDCERFGTATLTVENRGHTSQDVIIDGSNVGSLRVGEEGRFTVTSRVTHRLLHKFRDGHQCTPATFSIRSCGGERHWCPHFN